MPRDSARAFERRGRPTGRARGFRRVRARRERVEHRARTPCASARPRVRTSRSPFIDDDARASWASMGMECETPTPRPTDRDRAPRAAIAPRPHSRTRAFLQCLPSSRPPSSAASPPSRRPRSKCVFFRARARRARARRGADASRDARERAGGADAYRISRARAGARAGARGGARAGGRAGETRAWDCFASFAGAAGAAGARRAREGWIRARGGCARIRYAFRGDLSGATDRATG